ncbi:MAG TPA: ACT domain-containing protein [Candidatus Acidoferrum sp.]|nr:ACT domain-containing protein [Candidatus Acidoferrum sp.]
MAKTKQFTISVENQPGAVARIAKTLGDAKVNILSLLGTAQGTSGSLQLVAEDAKKAKKALDAAGIAYQETPAEQVELPNKAGSLAQCLDKLAAKGVNLNSIHATAAKGGKKAVIVYTVEAAPKSVTATA